MKIKQSIKDLTVEDLQWEIKVWESIDRPSFTIRNRIKSLRKHLERKLTTHGEKVRQE